MLLPVVCPVVGSEQHPLEPHVELYGIPALPLNYDGQLDGETPPSVVLLRECAA